MKPIKAIYRRAVTFGALSMLSYLWLTGQFEFSALSKRALFINGGIALLLLIFREPKRTTLPPL